MNSQKCYTINHKILDRLILNSYIDTMNFTKVKSTSLKLIISGILLLFFILFNYSIFCNLHLHTLDNGSLIVHAHPFDKNNNTYPIKSHSHSNLELLLFNLSLLIEFFIALILIFFFLGNSSPYRNLFRSFNLFLCKFYRLPVRRGPPSKENFYL